MAKKSGHAAVPPISPSQRCRGFLLQPPKSSSLPPSPTARCPSCAATRPAQPSRPPLPVLHRDLLLQLVVSMGRQRAGRRGEERRGASGGGKPFAARPLQNKRGWPAFAGHPGGARTQQLDRAERAIPSLPGGGSLVPAPLDTQGSGRAERRRSAL